MAKFQTFNLKTEIKMKTKLFLSFLSSLMIAFIIGAGISVIAPVDAYVASASVFTLRAVYFYNFGHELDMNALFAGLNKEIWIDKLKEKFWGQYGFIDNTEDWSEWVEYNTINYALMGDNPVIVKNNNSWPITAVQRTDTALTVVLDTYDSTTTRVRNLEEIETSYGKLDSVIGQHKNSLSEEIAKEGLFNFAPATAVGGAFAASGGNRTAVIGSQSTVASTLAIDDIARLKENWDAINAPQEGRILVLNPYHVRDLMKADITLNKDFVNAKAGEPVPLYGIDVYVTSLTPLYTKSTLAIKAYGAAADNVNDCVASVAYIKSEAFRCMGDVEMFYKEKGINPEQRADEVGFQVRAKLGKQRAQNFLYQAVVSNRA
jgi:hypothetical protein